MSEILRLRATSSKEDYVDENDDRSTSVYKLTLESNCALTRALHPIQSDWIGSVRYSWVQSRPVLSSSARLDLSMACVCVCVRYKPLVGRLTFDRMLLLSLILLAYCSPAGSYQRPYTSCIERSLANGIDITQFCFEPLARSLACSPQQQQATSCNDNLPVDSVAPKRLSSGKKMIRRNNDDECDREQSASSLAK